MAYEVNFGTMRVAASKPAAKKTGRFRLALLGDFSARTNRGLLDTGASLASRKPLKVDCDNLDATLKRFGVKLRLPIGADGVVVEVAVNAIDDLHPDQLYTSLPIFSELSGLRHRLKTPSTFAKAAKEVQAWAGIKLSRPRSVRARSAAIPVNGKLSDFARLIGAPTVPAKAAVSIADMLKQVVGPYIVPAKDPRQDPLVAMVDSALAATMRSVLHHPDFQAFEALWRSADLLVRRLETDETLQIVLYDLTAEEIAADLSTADALEESGLYKLLVEQPALDATQGPFAVIVGNYLFEQTPPHAELLGRIAKIVAQTQTAFIAAVGTSCLETKPADLHPLIRQSWDALAEMPEAGYVGLVVPRFMLRMPYGRRTDPVESFNFEEFTPQAGLSGMLWGNSAVIAGLLLGATFRREGAKMKPGSVLTLGEMPFYYYTDADGDQTALPCTERMLSSKVAEMVRRHRFMPMLSIKGRPEVRLGGFASLADGQLAGPWQPVTASSASSSSPPPAAEVEVPELEEKAGTAETTEASADSTEIPVEAPTGTAAQAPVEPAAEPSGGDPELDKLLTGFNEEAAPATPPGEAALDQNAEPEMDPELAKLLKELG
ncbi:MAG: type VI secretion system contractile sheath large subunit [Verrucomicrobiota bacterium]